MGAILELTDLSKGYGEGAARHEVLAGLDLSIEEGEFVAILGFSGAGKSTLISLLAGLEAADRGGVVYRGREIDGPSPERGVVFQSYSLMPWLSVEGNVALAVDSVARREPRRVRRDRITRYIDMVGLSHARGRRPAELSGGMRQRVALARALAMRPEVLLLDEPLSALDALTRARLQDELADICAREKRTIVLITNDVDEAILLADRVVALTQAPAATFGREFAVDIARPRERAAMNHDDDYIRLRGDITRYLMSLSAAGEPRGDTRIVLPNVVPIRRGPKGRHASRPRATGAAGAASPDHASSLADGSATRASSVPTTAPSSVTSAPASGGALPDAVRRAAASPRATRYLHFSDLGKTYPTPEGPLRVVDGFELAMDKGEFVTLIGHSGCGKSTVLSMAAGLNAITDGGIVLDGHHVTGAGPDRAVVFQAPSLMPWMSAHENVALGVSRVYPQATRAERRDVIEYYLERVGLADAMHRPAAELSNGMQQRVGIARAFALSPKLLLLDEPFGMLDSLTRWELQDVLMDVWARTKVTAVCVTHDVDEAILLADRVVMMSNGPAARVGNVMRVDLPRPRTREALLAHRDYYAYREELLDFLEAYEGGANPPPEVIAAIAARRSTRLGEAGGAAAIGAAPPVPGASGAVATAVPGKVPLPRPSELEQAS